MKINEAKLKKEVIEDVTSEMRKDLGNIKNIVEEFVDTYGLLIEIDTYYETERPTVEIILDN